MVPDFLKQAADMAGPYVPPVRMGGGSGGAFGASSGGRDFRSTGASPYLI